MTLDTALEERIRSIISSDDVVLFMKGTKTMPQCGFSATVVQVLNEVGTSFTTFNVLADPEIREGIKAFANWPTIPQLYVKGEFVGGCDIVREMYAKGELHQSLGFTAPEPITPQLQITAAAQAALSEAQQGAESPYVRLEVDGSFRHNLYFDQRRPTDVEVTVGELTVVIDPMSTHRANGLKLDFVSGPGGTGFKIDNPNAPPQVKSLSATELRDKLQAGEVQLFDVRTAQERDTATIEPSVLLDEEGQRVLESLDKSTPVAFFCHHGRRSAAAAEHYLQQGFREVYNLAGGIDAWSQEVDPSVPRY